MVQSLPTSHWAVASTWVSPQCNGKEATRWTTGDHRGLVGKGGSGENQGSQLGKHDEAFLWHHIYMTEQSHDSFTWRLKSMTYRYMTINYMKSSYMTLYLHEQHLHDGSLVWNPLIWLNYSFTWQMFTWQTLTWCFPSITWHSFA